MRSREIIMKRRMAWALLPVVLIGAVVAQSRSADKAKVDPAAVERARKQVRMLDDLYKTAVVLITEHYVHKEDDVAAGTAARLLFGAMKEKGWHEARLIDATGEPYEEKNAPADEFEKSAIAQIKAGKAFVDTVIEKDGKPYLRALTPVPVVMEKCIMCHAHYKNAAKGQAIGAIGYIVPIE